MIQPLRVLVMLHECNLNLISLISPRIYNTRFWLKNFCIIYTDSSCRTKESCFVDLPSSPVGLHIFCLCNVLTSLETKTFFIKVIYSWQHNIFCRITHSCLERFRTQYSRRQQYFEPKSPPESQTKILNESQWIRLWFLFSCEILPFCMVKIRI